MNRNVVTKRKKKKVQFTENVASQIFYFKLLYLPNPHILFHLYKFPVGFLIDFSSLPIAFTIELKKFFLKRVCPSFISALIQARRKSFIIVVRFRRLFIISEKELATETRAATCLRNGFCRGDSIVFQLTAVAFVQTTIMKVEKTKLTKPFLLRLRHGSLFTRENIRLVPFITARSKRMTWFLLYCDRLLGIMEGQLDNNNTIISVIMNDGFKIIKYKYISLQVNN